MRREEDAMEHAAQMEELRQKIELATLSLKAALISFVIAFLTALATMLPIYLHKLAAPTVTSPNAPLLPYTPPQAAPPATNNDLQNAN